MLGPILKSILYTSVVNLTQPDKVTAITYTAELILLVEAEDMINLMFKANYVLELRSI